ncbi:MAG: polysaccharide pyruvyl transferase family protein [Oscillospiraceae bacterium]|nr:polysaccharide pyruvyl transferase family protein [Oscillospiraceae bacterium]
MKILLVTLWSNNFGNRLQNYALQKVLQSQNHEVTNLLSTSKKDGIKTKVKNHIIAFYSKASLNIRFLARMIKNNSNIIRKIHFFDFNSKYFTVRQNIDSRNVSPDLIKRYNHAVTGSDQVWHNWSNSAQELDYFYLRFFPAARTIAYAASYGFKEFSEKDRQSHQQGVNHIRYISCREEDSVRLARQLTSNPVHLVCDPTFLLSTEEWTKIAEKPFFDVPEKFALLYFLGDDKAYKQSAKQIAKSSGLEPIDISTSKENHCSAIGPAQFVWLIKHSSMVFTDSFHAIVFSCIFHRNFLAYRRVMPDGTDMFGRIETLLNLFHLHNHEYQKEDCCPELPDFDAVDRKIDRMKQKSLVFLMNALQGRQTPLEENTYED